MTGYGATSDGYDMVQPSGEGAERCMKMALKTESGTVGFADGVLKADGKEIYSAENLKVGVYKS